MLLQITHLNFQGTVKELVRTSNVEEAIAHIGEAYDARKPVLLQGQIGSGNLFLVIIPYVLVKPRSSC